MSAHFDVQGTVSEDVPPSQQSVILRSFLAARFNLKARLEMREAPVYALTVAREGRLGPQLRRSAHNCAAWAQARRDAAPGESVLQLTDLEGRPLCTTSQIGRLGEGIYVRKSAGEISSLVSVIRGDLPLMIVDRTGLIGNFEWELTSETPGLRELVPGLPEKAPTLEVALQEQLGLRLVRIMAPVQALIIESVAMPTPN